MKCLRRLLPELNMEDEKLPPETLDKLIVNGDDFQNALKEVTPSGMRYEVPQLRNEGQRGYQ